MMLIKRILIKKIVYFDVVVLVVTEVHFFGTSVGVAVGRRSGSRLATTLVDRYFHHSFLSLSFLFFFFFSVVYFSHRRSARIKKLI